MTKRELCIVDVFAEKRYTGNPLAVIGHAHGLSDDEMLAITREMNYSETAFILSDIPTEGGYDVRIFNKRSEVPFAGYPALGTAFVINQELASAPAVTVTLNLPVGPIPVTFNGDGSLWMRQKPPQFGAVFDAATVATALGLSPEDVDSRFPVQSATTGLPFIIAPLKTLDAVHRTRVDLARLDALVASIDDPVQADMILVFAPEAYHDDNDFNVRVFLHHRGNPEGIATGSANGCLAGYLSKYHYFGSDQVDCRVEQGYEVGRRSLLMLRAQESDTGIEVNVGGRVIMVARGELL